VRAAVGRYILPLDADDKIHPTMLEKCARLLDEQPRIGVAYTDYQHFQDVDHVVRTPEYDRHVLMNQKCLHTASAMYRRAAWEATGGYRSNMVWGTEDWEFWVSCAEKGFIGQRIPEVLFFYRAKLNKSMLSVAKAHFPYLFGRLVLNHPNSYAEPMRQWARARWVEGLQVLIDDASHLGRYSLNQTLVELVEDGELLVAAGKVDFAVRYHRRWLELHSGAGTFGAHYNLGVYLIRLGRRAEARAEFERAQACRADYAPLADMLIECEV
jgi:tetratricopeptide (TPR) repeat protein